MNEAMTRGGLGEGGERQRGESETFTPWLFCSWPLGQLPCVFGNVFIYLLNTQSLALRSFFL